MDFKPKSHIKWFISDQTIWTIDLREQDLVQEACAEVRVRGDSNDAGRDNQILNRDELATVIVCNEA